MTRRAIGTLLLLAALTLPLPTLATGTAASAERLVDAIRFRAELGFDARPEVVKSMLDQGRVTAFGLALDPGEQRELQRRSDLRERLEPALAYIDGHPDAFGGAFFDQSVGDLLLVIQVIPSTTDVALDSLRRLLPVDARVAIQTATYSEQELDSLRDALLPLAPAAIRSMGVDVAANRLQVSTTAGGHAVVMSKAAERASALEFVADTEIGPASCTSRQACTQPWRGGTSTFADGVYCTWGFNARPTTSSTTKFLIESGHCSRLNKNVSHNSVVVNVAPGVDRNTYDLVGNQFTDSLSAPLKADVGARNLIYISSGSTSYAITSIKTGFNQQVGESVCMSGSVSNPGYKCGVIEAEGQIVTYPRAVDGKLQTFTALTRASFSSVLGDSGAPIISGTLPQAFGTLSALGGGKTWYSPIDLALDDLNLRLCLNASCS